MEIRKAKIEELDMLLDFEEKIIEAERPFNPILKEKNAHYYDLNELLASDSAAVLVAEIDGEIVASGYVAEKKAESYMNFESYAYLGFMYVKPEFRGKGVNQKVLDELIKWAKNRGVKDFFLNVNCQNSPAIKAYEKAGFDSLRVEMRMRID